MTADTLSIGLQVASSLGALGAALAAFFAARATKHAAEGQLLSAHLKEYGSDAMVRNLRLLRRWEHTHGQDFTVKFRTEMDSGNSEVDEIEKARREVKYFFYVAERLFASKLASQKFMREICSLAGLGILLHIVGPLEYFLLGVPDPMYEQYGQLCERFKIEEPTLRRTVVGQKDAANSK